MFKIDAEKLEALVKEEALLDIEEQFLERQNREINDRWREVRRRREAIRGDVARHVYGDPVCAA